MSGVDKDRPDSYAQHEERVVLRYFKRKALGDFSVPVPDLTLFDHVAAFSQPLVALACERECRALFLQVGEALTVEMCAELVEHVGDSLGRPVDATERSRLKGAISGIEDDISNLASELESLEDELYALETSALDRNYVPADAFPLAQQLERLGA